MSIFSKKIKISSEEQLQQSISQAFGGVSLWNLCRGNFDFLVNAVKDGSTAVITSALRKINRYSPENLDKMLSIQQKYQNGE